MWGTGRQYPDETLKCEHPGTRNVAASAACRVPDKQAKNRDVAVAGIGLRPLKSSDIRTGSGGQSSTATSFKSSSDSVLRSDTALILEYVPNTKSNDINKFVSVISLFIRVSSEGQTNATV